MADLPLMPKATAVWLVDNTTLTFEQISAFTGMHILEIEGVADGEVAQGIKGIDPVLTGQLTREELKRCEENPQARLRLVRKASILAPEPKRKGPRYTPLSKRQDRPSAIAWLVRYHPELPDSAISKLVGTTKTTIQSVRDKSHWNTANIRPVDPVALGLCKQVELDAAVARAAEKKAREEGGSVLSAEEKMRLMTTEQSLASGGSETRLPSSMAGLENFTLGEGGGGTQERDDDARRDPLDPDALFNLPERNADEEEDEDTFDPRR
ncbi:MAG: DUF1013 domain-containing protein [Rubrimonas sp.]|uniref:DUF1013 domain-containing protein n=1 Tax=Rubrimonas sp. TaxID=2036015 RepID=UPI002FDC8A78